MAFLVATCGTGPASPVPTSPPPAATPSPSIASPATSPSAGALVAASDPGLLSHVPAAIDGIALTYDPVTTGTVAADPSLSRDASALAMAIAVAPESSGSTNLTVVSVVHLRAATLTEDYFRSYRDTYDAASCATAGGVSGHSQATMSGRIVFIGSCTGGAFTYHVGLDDGPLIVSATSVGTMRLGEKVMKGIQP
jgi:hypothetical protein